MGSRFVITHYISRMLMIVLSLLAEQAAHPASVFGRTNHRSGALY